MPMPSAEPERTRPAPPKGASIGPSVTVKGDVTGDEDIYVQGTVDGSVDLPKNHLTIGPGGEVRGEVKARMVTVVGTVDGNISATERIEVCDSGVVDGDITTPRLLIREGAAFNGSITMIAKAPEVKRPKSTLRVETIEAAAITDDAFDLLDDDSEELEELDLKASDVESLPSTPTGPPVRLSAAITPPRATPSVSPVRITPTVPDYARKGPNSTKK